MQNKAAVILWLYHTDLADEFVELLKPHKEYIDIFLGLCKDHDHDNDYAESLFKDVFGKGVNIDHFNNGGTDILPTLNLLEKCINYPVFFKLHTKKNYWGNNKQVNWRVLLTNDLIYRDNLSHCITSLQRKDIGIVGSKSFIMRDNEHTNHQHILELCSLLNINYEKFRIKSFIGGNVFAAKVELFKPFLGNNKLKDLLSKEVGLIKDENKGTYVHSMERLFGYAAEYNNKNILGVPKPTWIILSPNIKKHRLHLVKLYNNSCYVQENPNIYGDIINDNQYDITIQWLNTKSNPQTYKKYTKYLINTNVKSTRSI
jgi:lipopolysaccharide biosynthesis protein